MQKLMVFLCIVSCFFAQAAYLEGQSANDAMANMANMEKALNNADAEFTPQDAYYLGRTVAANILAAYKPYENREITLYLNRICQALVINSPQPVSFNGYQVMILDSPEFNAFATTGGHIFLTKKLVESTASEDMLAAVIAHELAHIMLKHSIAIINDMQFANEMTATANQAAAFSGRNANTDRLMQFRNSISKTMDTIMKNGYSQTQEFEADRGAIELLARAGYNPGAMLEQLRVLQKVQKSETGGFFTTHPSPAERIANAEKVRSPRIPDTRKNRTARFKKVASWS